MPHHTLTNKPRPFSTSKKTKIELQQIQSPFKKFIDTLLSLDSERLKIDIDLSHLQLTDAEVDDYREKIASIEHTIETSSINLSANQLKNVASLNFFLSLCEPASFTILILNGNQLSFDYDKEAGQINLFINILVDTNITVINLEENCIDLKNSERFKENLSEALQRKGKTIDAIKLLISKQQQAGELVLEFSDAAEDLPQEKTERSPLLLGSNKSTSYALPTTYEISSIAYFRRFILREEWTLFLIEKLLLHRNNPYREARKLENWRQHFFSNAIPLESNQGIDRIFPIHTVRRTLSQFSQKAWPIVLLGLGLQDILRFLIAPTTRYGLSAGSLFSGFYRRGWGLISDEYDGFPNEAGFWLLPIMLLIMPPALLAMEYFFLRKALKQKTSLANILKKYCNEAESRYANLKQLLPYEPYPYVLQAASLLSAWDVDSQEIGQEWLESIIFLAKKSPLLLSFPAISTLGEIADHAKNSEKASLRATAANALNELVNDGKGWRKEWAQYQRWSTGRTIHTAFSPRPFIYSALYSLLCAAVAYTSYRYFQILVGRSRQASRFFTEQRECHDLHKIYHYSPATGNYDCTVCDFSFVPTLDANDPQACLNGLLRKPRKFSELQAELSHLQHFSGYRSINLIDWQDELSNWEEEKIRDFWQQLLSLSPQWDLVNISATSYNPLWPSTHNIGIIGHELNTVNVLGLDCKRLNMGPDHWRAFLTSWTPTLSLRYFDSGYNNYNDDGLYVFAEWIRNNTLALEEIHIPGNGCSDDGTVILLESLSFSNKTRLFDASDNQLTGAVLEPIAAWLPNSGIDVLNLSRNDLIGGNYSALGCAIAQPSTLRCLIMDYVNMGDPNIVDMALPMMNRTNNLEHFSAEGNFLTGAGIYQFGIAAGSQLSHTHWSNNVITDDDLKEYIGALFSHVSWYHIGLSSNLFTSNGVGGFWQSLVNTTVRSVSFASMRLDKAAVLPAIKMLDNGTLILDKLDMSNNRLPNTVAAELLDKSCAHNISEISLAKNSLTDLFSNMGRWSVYAHRCHKLDLSDNPFLDEAIAPFIKALPQMPFLQETKLDRCSYLGDPTISLISHTFLYPIPNPDYLQRDQQPYDEVRALNTSETTNNVIDLSMQEISVTKRGARELCHIIPHLGDMKIRISSDTVDINPWENCETSSATRSQSFFSRFIFWRQAELSEPSFFTNQNAKWQKIADMIPETPLAPSSFLPLQPSVDQEGGRYLAPSSNNNFLSAGLLLTVFPGINVIFLMFLLYLLARAIKTTPTTSFFAKSQNNREPLPLLASTPEPGRALN